LSKAQEKGRANQNDDHHIVAKAAAAAEPSRIVLGAVGINVNDPENRIMIDANLHDFLHRNEYYSAVNAIMGLALRIGEQYGNAKGAVKSALEGIGEILKGYDAKLK
jgi:hypothetical protein